MFRSVPIEGRLASPRTLRAVPLLWNTPDSYHAVDTTTLAASDATDKQIDDFRQLTRDPESLGSEARAFARSPDGRSEEHTSELQSLMRISYAVFCLNKKKTTNN